MKRYVLLLSLLMFSFSLHAQTIKCIFNTDSSTSDGRLLDEKFATLEIIDGITTPESIGENWNDWEVNLELEQYPFLTHGNVQVHMEYTDNATRDAVFLSSYNFFYKNISTYEGECTVSN